MLGKSPSIYFAFFIKFITLDLDGGLSKPPNSTVPTINLVPSVLFQIHDLKILGST